jgi:hypothetical protein
MDDLQKIFGGLTGIKPSKSWDIRQESLILIHWFCGTFYRRPDIFSPNCKVTTVFFSFKPIQGTKEVIWGWSPELDKGHAYGWSRYTSSPKRQWGVRGPGGYKSSQGLTKPRRYAKPNAMISPSNKCHPTPKHASTDNCLHIGLPVRTWFMRQYPFPHAICYPKWVKPTMVI